MHWLFIIGLVLAFGLLTIENAKQPVPENCTNIEVTCCSCSSTTCNNKEI